MRAMETKPYEGSEPYVFISYSHNDAAEILPILKALNQRGYRLWFDEGIIPGTEWPERIGERLLKSEVFLAFISPNSMDSINCRREINLALKNPNKKFVCVFLKDTELTPGMQLQMESQRNIYRKNFTDEESLLQAICSANGMRECKKITGSEPRENREELSSETKLPKEDKPDRRNKAEKASRRKIIIGISVLLFITAMIFLVFLAR